MATLMRWRPTGGQLLRRAAFGSLLARSVDCCCPVGPPDCNDCDPADNDPDPMLPLPLNILIEDALEATATLARVPVGAGESWAYTNVTIALTYSCGDGGWTTVNARVWCDTASGEVKCTLTGGSGSCTIAATTLPATEYECSPMRAVFEFRTDEIFPGGCPCGDNQLITVTVTE